MLNAHLPGYLDSRPTALDAQGYPIINHHGNIAMHLLQLPGCRAKWSWKLENSRSSMYAHLAPILIDKFDCQLRIEGEHVSFRLHVC